MREFLLALLVVASMPVFPQVLPVDASGVVILKIDCAVAQQNANRIAQGLGFSQARVTCMGGTARATLYGAHAPLAASVPTLIGYSIAEPRSFSPPTIATTFRVPADIPWVSTSGEIVAWVKTDALLLEIPTNNPLPAAFALENAGISRNDMVAERSDEGALYIRVRPLNIAQVLKIARIARQSPINSYVRTKTAFVRNCDDKIATLTGLALGVARDRASLMARAARTALGTPLGVVDPGGYVLDARCDLGADASAKQLADIVNASPDVRFANGGLGATVVRSVHVAWRLRLPPNPAGQPWNEQPDFNGLWDGTAQGPAFLADGQRAHADAVSPPDGIVPDRVTILTPDWAYGALRNSHYRTSVSLVTDPLQPAVVLRAATTAKLQKRVSEFQEYITRLAARVGKHPGLQFYYSRDDCRHATDAALLRATGDAIEGLHGAPIRYLQETSISTTGYVSCNYKPIEGDVTPNSHFGIDGAAVASVVVGY
ncbi:MAG TPA: hypothetical protein VFO29_02145 [Candidatus Rubrimentiphilum sp.]|nr:hypothetical protein [Candidatus Rubrimentiphilum sp.]